MFIMMNEWMNEWMNELWWHQWQNADRPIDDYRLYLQAYIRTTEMACAWCIFVAESFRESENQNKELSRSVQELTAIRMQLQSDRDAMEAELHDSRDSIRDLQSRLDSANSVMNQLKVDLDTRLRERDEEIENLRLVAVLFYCFYIYFRFTYRFFTFVLLSVVYFQWAEVCRRVVREFINNVKMSSKVQ